MYPIMQVVHRSINSDLLKVLKANKHTCKRVYDSAGMYCTYTNCPKEELKRIAVELGYKIRETELEISEITRT